MKRSTAKPRSITIGELAARWKVTARIVRNWWHAGIIPAPVDGRAAVLEWSISDVVEFEKQAGLTVRTRQEA
jgi:hypothetical protein